MAEMRGDLKAELAQQDTHVGVLTALLAAYACGLAALAVQK
jgi:hypothetical protein